MESLGKFSLSSSYSKKTASKRAGDRQPLQERQTDRKTRESTVERERETEQRRGHKKKKDRGRKWGDHMKESEE